MKRARSSAAATRLLILLVPRMEWWLRERLRARASAFDALAANALVLWITVPLLVVGVLLLTVAAGLTLWLREHP